MMSEPTFSATESPAGVFLISQCLPPRISEYGWEAAKRRLRYGVRGNHWSVYVRGWFYDVTSELADSTEYYWFRFSSPKLRFRARRDIDENDTSKALPRYWGIRIGTTDRPTWMLYEIGRRIVFAMNTYSIMLHNCHHFASAFMVCVLQEESIPGLMSHEPVCTLSRLLDQREIDAWDARCLEKAARGEQPKFWIENLNIPYWVRVIMLRTVFRKNKGPRDPDPDELLLLLISESHIENLILTKEPPLPARISLQDGSMAYILSFASLQQLVSEQIQVNG
ncbi:hypothetical protein WOLCODRAFT_163888 [Wolfiporia cocos MD-104 SS10]|uniref:DUF862-domain-containing protein n=1 Tax=Wolfiporia cocos (strain MD-104) TaxID=742152 RepID=A0A2H3JRN8_WOLCO|nr:hypothetical protein WOLCODRAFT_163888 [Wolfiporia cocos MD-104 SS10]